MLAAALIAVSCTWIVTSRNSVDKSYASSDTVSAAEGKPESTAESKPESTPESKPESVPESQPESKPEEAETDALSLWTDGAALKTDLTSYMKAITDPSSADNIPVEARIDVFDMDGTPCCDDTERENGNVTKAEQMVELCEKNGWTAVSMKNDWKTIYGDGVKYLGQKELEVAA